MRFVIGIVVALGSMQCIAQDRVFRSSMTDIQQDIRLDCLESRVTALEAAPVEQPTEPKQEPIAWPQVQPKPPSTPVKQPSKPATTEKPYAVITIETLPGCDPCNRWKAKEARELRAVGWTVVEAPLTSSNSAPFFRICIGERCFTHRGSMSHNALRRILAMVDGTPQATSQKSSPQKSKSRWYSTAELRAMIKALRPGGWSGAVYASVARNQAKAHLVSSAHGFTWNQVAGLTTDEALILHDLAPNHGNKIFPTTR